MNNLTIDQKNLLIMALKGYELNIIKLKDFRLIDSKHADKTIKDINTIKYTFFLYFLRYCHNVLMSFFICIFFFYYSRLSDMIKVDEIG